MAIQLEDIGIFENVVDAAVSNKLVRMIPITTGGWKIFLQSPQCHEEIKSALDISPLRYADHYNDNRYGIIIISDRVRRNYLTMYLTGIDVSDLPGDGVICDY